MVDLQMDHRISDWCDISFEKSFEEKNPAAKNTINCGQRTMTLKFKFYGNADRISHKPNIIPELWDR